MWDGWDRRLASEAVCFLILATPRRVPDCYGYLICEMGILIKNLAEPNATLFPSPSGLCYLQERMSMSERIPSSPYRRIYAVG